MGFLKFFTSLFKSIFKTSSVDSKTRGELKKIEAELKLHSPAIYKSKSLMANVAEAFVLLYTNTKYIEEILSSTIKSLDVQRATHFANKLILTGFSSEAIELQEDIAFTKRKEEILASKDDSHIYTQQAKNLDQLLKFLSQDEFLQINTIIARLYQLCDICRFNFISAIRIFVPDFSENTDIEKNEIKNVPIEDLETALIDLYYITKDFQITSSMAKAIIALASIHQGEKNVDQDKIIDNLKKISYVFKHIIEPPTILKLVMISKQNPALELETAKYTSSVLSNYVEKIRKQFEIDTNRIKMEIQDETVASEIKSLFKERDMEFLTGYNSEQNNYLLESGVSAFSFITPMQVLKTFLTTHMGSNIQALLNDIVVEGFFCNSDFKTDFSSAVFATLEIQEKIQNFESSFDRGKPNDIAVIRGYIADSHTNPEFLIKLNQLVNQINSSALKLLEEQSQHIMKLYGFLVDMIEDAHLISPINITNIKVLLASSRNKENASQLEGQLPSWSLFFDVMRHYIGLAGKQ